MIDRALRGALIAGTWCLLAPTASRAQEATDLSVLGIATFASDAFVGGGVGVGVRPSGRLRVAVLGAVGREAGSLAGRAELVAVFHLNPYKRAGWTAYGGGGAALAASSGVEREYLVVLIGVESRPARGRGWFAELGVGGGVRVALGVRLRRVAPRR